MNSDARTAFRQAEIRAMNEEATSAAAAGDQARSDFLRSEIAARNAEDDNAKLAKWGLLGLVGILVLSVFTTPQRSKR